MTDTTFTRSERILSRAVRLLPATAAERYRAEFAAELAEIEGERERFAYVVRVVTRLPRLRRSLPPIPSPGLLVLAALCLLAASALQGWAAYQRWWPTCFAPDPASRWANPHFGPLAEAGPGFAPASPTVDPYWACLNAQENGYFIFLDTITDGIPMEFLALSGSYALMAVVCALVPYAFGSPAQWRPMGWAAGAAYGALAYVNAAPGARGFLTDAAAISAFLAPFGVAALLFVCAGDLSRGRGQTLQWLLAGAVLLTFPVEDELVTIGVTGYSPHDYAPGVGVPTAVAMAVAGVCMATFAVIAQRRRSSATAASPASGRPRPGGLELAQP